jgi:hypothetical protein
LGHHSLVVAEHELLSTDSDVAEVPATQDRIEDHSSRLVYADAWFV